MNKRLVAGILTLTLGSATAGTLALAQTEKKEETKVKTADKTTKMKTSTYTGTVKSLDPGKKLKVLVGKKTRSFTLDAKDVNVSVDPAIAVGSKVKVVEEKDGKGIKSLTVTPHS